MRAKNFYESLPGFKSFEDLFKDENFFQVPDDWSVVLTDVKGSTQAIKEGRYKEVNTVGAASIVAAREALEGEDVPFVFGGDGATLLVPPEKLDKVLQILNSLKTLSAANYNLALRVGACKVADITAEGKFIEVARYELVKGRAVAIFRGNGIALAEKFIKNNPERYEISLEASEAPSLNKLSCRWSPIPNKRGKILSFMVLSATENTEVYSKLLSRLKEIFPKGLESLNPANVELMSYKSFSQIIEDEKKLHHSMLSPKGILRFLEIIASVLIFRLKLIPNFLFPSTQYALSMRTHSDFRKFDDALRMVIDCSQEEADKLKLCLEDFYRAGEIFYGLFESKNSLMTCYLMEGTGEGGHIHFIDGDNGGYAMAAVQLKKQIQDSRSS